jgi:hypothetical protein
MIKEEVIRHLIGIRSSKDEDERKMRRTELNDWFYTLSEAEQVEAKVALSEDMIRVKRELRAIREEVEMVMEGAYREAS